MTDQNEIPEDENFETIDEILEAFVGPVIREYKEAEELMLYVWRNYPEIVRPYECLGSHEQIRDLLPAEMRAEYWQHVLECREVVRTTQAREEQLLRETNSYYTLTPIMPELPPVLSEVVWKLQQELEQQLFWEKFQPHQEHVSISRCPACNKIVNNDKTRQCLWCGHDWH